MSTIWLALHTAKHLTFRQIRYRIRYQLFKKIKRKMKIKVVRGYNKDFRFSCINHGTNIPENVRLYDLSNSSRLLKNQFSFLNSMEYSFSKEIDWKANPFNYRLWNFKLNYFDYLEELIVANLITKDQTYINKGIDLIDSWIKRELSNYDANTWDPYVVAKRVINWIFFFSYMGIEEINEKYTNAINTQVIFLLNNVEYYLGANHLLMDAKGLLFGGIFLKNSNVINVGLDLLKKEYDEQFLNDGGHYERSSSYQVEVLMHYVECSLLLLKNGYILEGDKILLDLRKNVEYLFDLFMPNGEIPLLNDSTLDYPMNAIDFLECASVLYNEPKFKKFSNKKVSLYFYKLFGEEGIKKWMKLEYKNQHPSCSFFSESGYYIIKDLIKEKEMYFLFDCGDCGPDYNLGHAHADSLSVIMTIDNKKLLVDSGTYTYQISSARDYFRSTAAHNTITIDELSSSQVWKAFRVAKRAKTTVLNKVENHNFIMISAKHDGYAKVLKNEKIFHTRTVIYFKQKGFFIIDNLYGEINGTHLAKMRFIFGQQVEILNERELEIGNVRMKFMDQYLHVNVELSEEFNILKETASIIISKSFDRQILMVSIIKLSDCVLDATIQDNQQGIKLEVGSQKYGYTTKNQNLEELS